MGPGHMTCHGRREPRAGTRSSLECPVPLPASIWSKAKGCCLLLFEKYLLIPTSGPLHMLIASQKYLSLFRVNLKYHLLHEALPDFPPSEQNLPFLCSPSPGA